MTTNNQHYSTNNQVVQEIPKGVGGMWSMPAFWNKNVYFWGEGDFLVDYSLTNGLLSAQPASQSTFTITYPGSVPTVSAQGTTNGIVWAIDASGETTPAQAILRAFDATNLNTVLYDSTKGVASGRDKAGVGVKFSIATVANGKLYMGTQTELDVYGPLP